jgi:hypothetical protein
MAKQVQIDIIIESANAARSVKSITDSIVELKDAMKTVGEGSDDFKKLDTAAKKLEGNLEKVGDNSKKAGTGVAGLSGSIAKGIGIVKVFEVGISTLTNAFTSNQKGADLLAKFTGALSIVMNEVVDVIFNVVEGVSDSTNGFEALGKVITGLITIALTPLKVTFFGIKLVIQEAQLAWEESFFGDGDVETIKQLNLSIIETKLALSEVAADAITAGKDVINNFVPAITSIGKVVEGVIEGVSKIDVKAAIAQSDALVKLQNNAKLSEAQAGRLAAQFENQAEILRQIRDDESISIADRTKANNQLAIVLDNQEKALQKQADAGVAAARANLDVNNTIENQVALTNALAAKDQILADIQGKRSEQKVNAIALGKEELQLNQTVTDGEVQRQIIQNEFDAKREENEILRLEKLRENIEIEKTLQLNLLQDKINSYTEGTTARAEAEQQFLDKKQEFDNKIVESDEELAKKREEIAKKEIENQKQLNDLKLQATLAGLTLISDLVTAFGGKSEAQQKKAFNVQKALSIASTTIETFSAAQKAYSSQIIPGVPDPSGPVRGAIAAGIAIAGGLGRVAKIAATKFNSSGGGGGGGDTSQSIPAVGTTIAAGATPNVPSASPNSFALFGTAGSANNLGSQPQPLQAYVVESQITDVQDRLTRFRSAIEL